MLSALISEANSLGWSVGLRQHPDNLSHWECAISRRHTEPHPNGIVREIAYAQGDSPAAALDLALDKAASLLSEFVEPTGTFVHTEPIPLNLLDLLRLNKPAAPAITRRI